LRTKEEPQDYTINNDFNSNAAVKAEPGGERDLLRHQNLDIKTEPFHVRLAINPNADYEPSPELASLINAHKSKSNDAAPGDMPSTSSATAVTSDRQISGLKRPKVEDDWSEGLRKKIKEEPGR